MPTKKHDRALALDQVLKLVKDEGYSITKASKVFKIPRTTIYNWIRRPVSDPYKKCHLSAEDEKQLVSATIFSSRCATPITTQWIRETASRLACERNTPFKEELPSRGWLKRFCERHPELQEHVTDMNNVCLASKNKDSNINQFFTDAEKFLQEEGLLNEPSRIYNIDESLFCGQNVKDQKIVIKKLKNPPQKPYKGMQEQVAFTMGVSASGDWLPPMFIFEEPLPNTSEYQSLGPVNALYKGTETGHTDTDCYFEYIQHIEPFLNQTRPVVIFQENLQRHEHVELIEFCMSNGIHLYNFPSNSCTQPVDKLFDKLQNKMYDVISMLLEKFSKLNVPYVCKLSMDDIEASAIQNAFTVAGICPLNKDITSYLPGYKIPDIPQLKKKKKKNKKKPVCTDDDRKQPIKLEVFEGEIQEEKYKSQYVQTEPLKTLPCSMCYKNDVALHPAISAGVVDVELASVFIPVTSEEAPTATNPPPATNPPSTGRKKKPNIAEERLVTNISNMERLQSKERKRNVAYRQMEAERKEATKRETVGRLTDKEFCSTCKKRPSIEETSTCVLCQVKYHVACLPFTCTSFTTVCLACSTK